MYRFSDIEKDIQSKYLKAPTREQVLSFVEEVGIPYYHFECYYGMARSTIKKAKSGFRKIPIKHWPIFYERIVPQYGAGFNFKKPVKKVSKKVKKKEVIENDAANESNPNRLGHV